MLTRREAIRNSAILTATLATASVWPQLQAQAAAAANPPQQGAFKLPPLPYAYDALEPHIDARTMEIHHGKHHAGYVNNLNKAVAEAPALAKKSVEDLLRDLSALPDTVRTAVRNNGGGHYNHTLFWQMMKKGGGGAPKGKLAKALETHFQSMDGFKEKFTEAATKVFGSGWAWLTMNEKKELFIETTPNQDTPWSNGRIPLLGIDVWEHAYYLNYQNRRADYIAAFYNVVNWEFVARRFEKGRA